MTFYSFKEPSLPIGLLEKNKNGTCWTKILNMLFSQFESDTLIKNKVSYFIRILIKNIGKIREIYRSEIGLLK